MDCFCEFVTRWVGHFEKGVRISVSRFESCLYGEYLRNVGRQIKNSLPSTANPENSVQFLKPHVLERRRGHRHRLSRRPYHGLHLGRRRRTVEGSVKGVTWAC